MGPGAVHVAEVEQLLRTSGSTASRFVRLVSTLALPARTGVTASTSGSAATCLARSGLMPTPKPGPMMMKSVWNCESTALEIDAFADAAKIVMKPTSATPMSELAVAVVAVRFGFRAAFCRASTPVMSSTVGEGTAITRAVNRACYQVSACKSGRAVACDEGVTWDPLFLRCCPRYTPRMEGAMSDLLKHFRRRHA